MLKRGPINRIYGFKGLNTMKSLKTKMSIGFYVSVLYNSWLDNIHSQRPRSYWLQIQESFTLASKVRVQVLQLFTN